jgi:hypothetical protein
MQYPFIFSTNEHFTMLLIELSSGAAMHGDAVVSSALVNPIDQYEEQ